MVCRQARVVRSYITNAVGNAYLITVEMILCNICPLIFPGSSSNLYLVSHTANTAALSQVKYTCASIWLYVTIPGFAALACHNWQFKVDECV